MCKVKKKLQYKKYMTRGGKNPKLNTVHENHIHLELKKLAFPFTHKGASTWA